MREKAIGIIVIVFLLFVAMPTFAGNVWYGPADILETGVLQDGRIKLRVDNGSWIKILYIAESNPDRNELYATVLTAYSSSQQIKIYFDNTNSQIKQILLQ